MADRAITRARHDRNGDITAIGDGVSYWSPVPKDSAIYHIEHGIYRYYVPWANSPHTLIRVVNGPNGKYLRTDRDESSRNNLDDLPEC